MALKDLTVALEDLTEGAEGAAGKIGMSSAELAAIMDKVSGAGGVA